MTLRKQKPNEPDAEYELYLESKRIGRRSYKNAWDAANRDKAKALYYANRESILAQKKAYRAANKEAIKAKKKAYDAVYNAANKEQKKARNIKSRYGLTPDEYTALVENGCKICGSFERLHVDHNHTTGEVRGCLCHICNTSLGSYEKYILPNLDKFTKYLGGTL
jgi:hypothetical protein